MAVGRLGAFGAEGITNVALSGFDSPLELVKKTVTGYFFPAIEGLIGISRITLVPTTSPRIDLLFVIPRELLNRYPFVASAPAFEVASTVTTTEVPIILDLKFLGATGTEVTLTPSRSSGI